MFLILFCVSKTGKRLGQNNNVEALKGRCMKQAALTGLNFGLTSGVITTLGLMVGLHSGTQSTLAVIGGIVTIAIADSLSDALGIHISKEAEPGVSKTDVWLATLMTLLAKMLMAISFIIPVFLLPIAEAIITSIAWGLLVITLLSYKLAVRQGEKPWHVVMEHLAITLLVIVCTHFVGVWIAEIFK